MKYGWIKSNPIRVGNTTFGAVPENAIVMVGTVFDINDKLVFDHKKGLFDKKKVKEDIEMADSLALELSLGHTIDVLAETPDAMVNYLSYVFEITESPIMIDGTTAEVRLAGAKYAYEVGEIDRCIYDAISPDTPDKELFEIKECHVKTSVFYALNPTDFRPEGRVKILKEKLFQHKEKSGISQFLIDTIVMDPPSVGFAGIAFNAVKEHFGYPTGNAPLNATWMFKDTWPYSEQAYYSFIVSFMSFLQTMGADYLFYDRPAMAQHIFPSVAMINGILAYSYKQMGEDIQLTKDHTLYRVLKRISGKL